MKSVQVKLQFTKSTKNTHVYHSTGKDRNILPALYIQKDALPREAPPEILVEISVSQ